MAENKNMKKSHQTRILIMESFLDIMRSKNLESITVKSIVEGANITRGTFYLYFTDINDLILYIEQNLLDEFPECLPGEGLGSFLGIPTKEQCSPTDWELAIFDYYKKYAKPLNILLGPHGDHQFYNKLKKKIQSELHSQIIVDGAPDDSFRHYFENLIPDLFLILAREAHSGSSPFSMDEKALADIMSTIRIGAKFKASFEK